MTTDQLHDLAAGYALDALAEDERRAFERHLKNCEPCRAEVAALGETAGALALAVEGPAPSNGLRGRILEAAGAEQPNVVPLRSRRRAVTVATLAAAAAAALALGLWAALNDAPSARRVAFEGVNGTLIVQPSGEARMELTGLEPAPAGKDYEAWVIESGKAQRAGIFDGGQRVVVRLQRSVPTGATVAVTLERDGGVDSPTGEPLFEARLST